MQGTEESVKERTSWEMHPQELMLSLLVVVGGCWWG